MAAPSANTVDNASTADDALQLPVAVPAIPVTDRFAGC